MFKTGHPATFAILLIPGRSAPFRSPILWLSIQRSARSRSRKPLQRVRRRRTRYEKGRQANGARLDTTCPFEQGRIGKLLSPLAASRPLKRPLRDCDIRTFTEPRFSLRRINTLPSASMPCVKHRLRTVETDGCDRLHDWLLRIVRALTAPHFLGTHLPVEEPCTASGAWPPGGYSSRRPVPCVLSA
jgi:hypothetical protein